MNRSQGGGNQGRHYGGGHGGGNQGRHYGGGHGGGYRHPQHYRHGYRPWNGNRLYNYGYGYNPYNNFNTIAYPVYQPYPYPYAYDPYDLDNNPYTPY